MPSIELYFGDQDLGKYKIVKDETTVGRDPTADIVIDNLGISRIHCTYVKRNNIYAVEDAESSNGTFVNGKRVVSHNLNEGDEVIIGKYRMIFHYHSDVGKVADQGTQAVASGGGVMPDTLKTYVMDGKSIREQLKQMEAKTEAGGEVSAADYAAMMDPLKPRMPATQRYQKESSGLLTFLYLSLIANVLLFLTIVALGILFVIYVLPALSGVQKEKPAVEAPENAGGDAGDTGQGEAVDDLLRDL